MAPSIIGLIQIKISREEAISALVGFHGCPLSCWNWNLKVFKVCVFLCTYSFHAKMKSCNGHK